MTTSFTTSSDILPQTLRALIPYYLLILAVAIFYSNVYDNAFLYDDKYLILQNSYLRGWHSLSSIFQSYATTGAYRTGHFYRPLQNLLYLVIYQMAGPSLFAFHALNVILHAANACLAYALGRKMNFNAGAVFCGALIWALHPVHTEAVTYISATADVLFTFFCLVGLLILLPDFTLRKIVWAMPVFLLALLSKEAAIIFPLLVIVCMYGTGQPKATYLRTWPLWLVALAYLAARFVVLPFHGDELLNIDPNSKMYGSHIAIRIYTFLATIPSYLQLLVWPAGLHMDRDFPAYTDPWQIEVYAGIAVIAVAAAFIYRSHRTGQEKPFAWGLLWFAAAHIPQTGILVPVNSLFLEHWMYLPSLGLSLGIAQTLANAVQKPQTASLAAIAAFALAMVLGCLTYQQNGLWHDEIGFYRNILDHGESSVRARNNLGVAYMNNGEYDKAMEQFRLALKKYDLTPETHQNIAAWLSKSPDGKPHTDEEIAELQKALAINPDFWPACNGLAELYAFKGDTVKSETYRRKADDLLKRFKPQ